MVSLIVNVAHLKVKKIRRGYLVVNTKTGYHTHMRSKYGCYCVIKFIREGIDPDNSYLKESVRRLKQERKEKQYYINIQKGVQI